MKDATPPVSKLRVWDPPTRLFHWLLAALVAVNIYTGLVGGLTEMEIHFWSGYAILALIVFRLVWGVIGSRHSRFANFIAGPRRVVGYLANLARGRHAPTVSHNPLGALSVLALLIVLAVQAGTGLFASDDIFTEGPLADTVSADAVNTLTSIHHAGATVLYVLIGLHVATVLAYLALLKVNLIRPMITGRKDAASFPGAADQPFASPWRAAVAAAAAGLGVWALLQI